MTNLSTLKQAATESELSIGVTKNDRKDLVHALCKCLADTFVLHTKTLAFHWNVVGPNFYGLHKLTEEQYQDLHQAMDSIAERIRILGFVAPQAGSFLISTSALEEAKEDMTSEEMIRDLLADNERSAKTFRFGVSMAEAANDTKTADLLSERIGVHEEHAWMLRSMLGQ